MLAHAVVAALASVALSLDIDGWYNCSQETFWRNGAANRRLSENVAPFENSVPVSAQCAQYFLPLCHPGQCNSTRTIPVFAKRLRAITPNAKVFWVLQGGPGSSSVNMEPLMIEIYERMHHNVTVMTIDHRGTGRSSLLACTAAQAMTPGSPQGTKVAIEELPDCLRDINYVYGNANAFSVTSAAMDLLSIIDADQSKQEVYIYGVSYGTFWVERVMAIQNQNVNRGRSIRGYILDGVVPHSGNQYLYFSDWDRTMSAVGWTYLGQCNKDSFCRSKFPRISLQSATLALYANLKNKSARCTSFVQAICGGVDDLKELFGILIMGSSLRLLIPVLIISRIFTILQEHGYIGAEVESNSSGYDSEILYATIAFSELWPRESPSYASIKQQFDNGVMGLREYLQFPDYCIYSGSTIPDCQPYRSSTSFSYPLDKYAFQKLQIPENASVLLLNGGLDSQTPLLGARDQLSLLSGQRKKLIEFPYAVHAISYTTWTYQSTKRTTCGADLIVSYLSVKGDLDRLDESCVALVPPLRFQLSTKFSQVFGGVDDLYDGQVMLKNTTESTITTSSTTLPVNSIDNTSFDPFELTSPPIDSLVLTPAPSNTTAILSSALTTPSPSSLGYSLAGLMTCLFVVAVLVAVKYYREAKALTTRYAAFQEEV